MSAAPSPAPRCSHEYQWIGVGRHRHSSGYNPTFRCTREEGHDGPHACERMPRPELAPILIAELPAPSPPKNTPRPLTPETLAKVKSERSRFHAAVIRQPLPANEAAAQKELRRMRDAIRWPISKHFFRRWLEGNT